jgi:hypothetical protein
MATAALAIAIFIVDTVTTLDIAVAVLYVVVVLMATNFLQRRGVLLVGLGMHNTDAGELFVVAWPHRRHGSCQVPDEPLGDRSHDFPRHEESIH